MLPPLGEYILPPHTNERSFANIKNADGESLVWEEKVGESLKKGK